MDVRHVRVGGHMPHTMPSPIKQINLMQPVSSDHQATVHPAGPPLAVRPSQGVMSESGSLGKVTKNAEHGTMQSEGPTSGARNSFGCQRLNGVETDTQRFDKQIPDSQFKERNLMIPPTCKSLSDPIETSMDRHRARGSDSNISSPNIVKNTSNVASEKHDDSNIANKGSNEREIGSKNRHQSFFIYIYIPGNQSEPPDPIQIELTIFQSIRL